MDRYCEQTLWRKYVLEAQNCDANEQRIMRDNQSTMILESNGKAMGKQAAAKE